MLSQSSLASVTTRSRRNDKIDDLFFGKQKGVQSEASDCIGEWLTSDEAAAFLKISPATLRNLTSTGKIPFYKFGRRNRYNKYELTRMLLSSRKGA